jgi:hypothetical protein
LKNVTERCDRLRVTFTFSSRSTSLSGDGRKSSTILTRPISPLLYSTVGFFIYRHSFHRSPKRKAINLTVMPALVAGIHVFLWRNMKTWMAGSSPAMTG